jgi:hypothetical protein
VDRLLKWVHCDEYAAQVQNDMGIADSCYDELVLGDLPGLARAAEMVRRLELFMITDVGDTKPGPNAALVNGRDNRSTIPPCPWRPLTVGTARLFMLAWRNTALQTVPIGYVC